SNGEGPRWTRAPNGPPPIERGGALGITPAAGRGRARRVDRYFSRRSARSDAGAAKVPVLEEPRRRGPHDAPRLRGARSNSRQGHQVHGGIGERCGTVQGGFSVRRFGGILAGWKKRRKRA